MTTTQRPSFPPPPEQRPGEEWGPALRPPAAQAGGRARRRGFGVREFVFGSERRLGLWMIPLFLMTALLGATMAGSLAVLYYGQRVSELESTTARARAQLDQVSEDVTVTAEEAQAAIEEQVRQVRESLAQGLPIGPPNDSGVYAVSARHADGEVRVGSSFTIYSDASETFLVTNYRVVATDDGWALGGVELFLPDRTVSAAVHNFDRELDLAVLVVRGGPLPVLEWRPGDQRISRGDALYVAGIAGPGTAAIVEGKVTGVSETAIVPSLPLNEFLGGGPVLDASGKVMGIASLTYRPFGNVDGDLRYAVPVRALCRRLVRCTEADMAAGGLGDEGSGPAGRPREPAPQPPPGSSPGGQPTAAPEPQPAPSPARTATPPPDGGDPPPSPAP